MLARIFKNTLKIFYILFFLEVGFISLVHGASKNKLSNREVAELLLKEIESRKWKIGQGEASKIEKFLDQNDQNNDYGEFIDLWKKDGRVPQFAAEVTKTFEAWFGKYSDFREKDNAPVDNNKEKDEKDEKEKEYSIVEWSSTIFSGIKCEDLCIGYFSEKLQYYCHTEFSNLENEVVQTNPDQIKTLISTLIKLKQKSSLSFEELYDIYFLHKIVVKHIEEQMYFWYKDSEKEDSEKLFESDYGDLFYEKGQGRLLKYIQDWNLTEEQYWNMNEKEREESNKKLTTDRRSLVPHFKEIALLLEAIDAVRVEQQKLAFFKSVPQLSKITQIQFEFFQKNIENMLKQPHNHQLLDLEAKLEDYLKNDKSDNDKSDNECQVKRAKMEELLVNVQVRPFLANVQQSFFPNLKSHFKTVIDECIRKNLGVLKSTFFEYDAKNNQLEVNASAFSQYLLGDEKHNYAKDDLSVARLMISLKEYIVDDLSVARLMVSLKESIVAASSVDKKNDSVDKKFDEIQLKNEMQLQNLIRQLVALTRVMLEKNDADFATVLLDQLFIRFDVKKSLKKRNLLANLLFFVVQQYSAKNAGKEKNLVIKIFQQKLVEYGYSNLVFLWNEETESKENITVQFGDDKKFLKKGFYIAPANIISFFIIPTYSQVWDWWYSQKFFEKIRKKEDYTLFIEMIECMKSLPDDIDKIEPIGTKFFQYNMLSAVFQQIFRSLIYVRYGNVSSDVIVLNKLYGKPVLNVQRLSESIVNSFDFQHIHLFQNDLIYFKDVIEDLGQQWGRFDFKEKEEDGKLDIQAMFVKKDQLCYFKKQSKSLEAFFKHIVEEYFLSDRSSFYEIEFDKFSDFFNKFKEKNKKMLSAGPANEALSLVYAIKKAICICRQQMQIIEEDSSLAITNMIIDNKSIGSMVKLLQKEDDLDVLDRTVVNSFPFSEKNFENYMKYSNSVLNDLIAPLIHINELFELPKVHIKDIMLQKNCWLSASGRLKAVQKWLADAIEIAGKYGLKLEEEEKLKLNGITQAVYAKKSSVLSPVVFNDQQVKELLKDENFRTSIKDSGTAQSFLTALQQLSDSEKKKLDEKQEQINLLGENVKELKKKLDLLKTNKPAAIVSDDKATEEDRKKFASEEQQYDIQLKEGEAKFTESDNQLQQLRQDIEKITLNIEQYKNVMEGVQKLITKLEEAELRDAKEKEEEFNRNAQGIYEAQRKEVEEKFIRMKIQYECFLERLKFLWAIAQSYEKIVELHQTVGHVLMKPVLDSWEEWNKILTGLMSQKFSVYESFDIRNLSAIYTLQADIVGGDELEFLRTEKGTPLSAQYNQSIEDLLGSYHDNQKYQSMVFIRQWLQLINAFKQKGTAIDNRLLEQLSSSEKNMVVTLFAIIYKADFLQKVNPNKKKKNDLLSSSFVRYITPENEFYKSIISILKNNEIEKFTFQSQALAVRKATEDENDKKEAASDSFKVDETFLPFCLSVDETALIQWSNSFFQEKARKSDDFSVDENSSEEIIERKRNDDEWKKANESGSILYEHVAALKSASKSFTHSKNNLLSDTSALTISTSLATTEVTDTKENGTITNNKPISYDGFIKLVIAIRNLPENINDLPEFNIIMPLCSSPAAEKVAQALFGLKYGLSQEFTKSRWNTSCNIGSENRKQLEMITDSVKNILHNTLREQERAIGHFTHWLGTSLAEIRQKFDSMTQSLSINEIIEIEQREQKHEGSQKVAAIVSFVNKKSAVIDRNLLMRKIFHTESLNLQQSCYEHLENLISYLKFNLNQAAMKELIPYIFNKVARFQTTDSMQRAIEDLDEFIVKILPKNTYDNYDAIVSFKLLWDMMRLKIIVYSARSEKSSDLQSLPPQGSVFFNESMIQRYIIPLLVKCVKGIERDKDLLFVKNYQLLEAVLSFDSAFVISDDDDAGKICKELNCFVYYHPDDFDVALRSIFKAIRDEQIPESLFRANNDSYNMSLLALLNSCLKAKYGKDSLKIDTFKKRFPQRYLNVGNGNSDFSDSVCYVDTTQKKKEVKGDKQAEAVRARAVHIVLIQKKELAPAVDQVRRFQIDVKIDERQLWRRVFRRDYDEDEVNSFHCINNKNMKNHLSVIKKRINELVNLASEEASLNSVFVLLNRVNLLVASFDVNDNMDTIVQNFHLFIEKEFVMQSKWKYALPGFELLWHMIHLKCELEKPAISVTNYRCDQNIRYSEEMIQAYIMPALNKLISTENLLGQQKSLFLSIALGIDNGIKDKDKVLERQLYDLFKKNQDNYDGLVTSPENSALFSYSCEVIRTGKVPLSRVMEHFQRPDDRRIIFDYVSILSRFKYEHGLTEGAFKQLVPSGISYAFDLQHDEKDQKSSLHSMMRGTYVENCFGNSLYGRLTGRFINNYLEYIYSILDESKADAESYTKVQEWLYEFFEMVVNPIVPIGENSIKKMLNTLNIATLVGSNSNDDSQKRMQQLKRSLFTLCVYFYFKKYGDIKELLVPDTQFIFMLRKKIIGSDKFDYLYNEDLFDAVTRYHGISSNESLESLVLPYLDEGPEKINQALCTVLKDTIDSDQSKMHPIDNETEYTFYNRIDSAFSRVAVSRIAANVPVYKKHSLYYLKGAFFKKMVQKVILTLVVMTGLTATAMLSYYLLNKELIREYLQEKNYLALWHHFTNFIKVNFLEGVSKVSNIKVSNIFSKRRLRTSSSQITIA